MPNCDTHYHTKLMSLVTSATNLVETINEAQSLKKCMNRMDLHVVDKNLLLNIVSKTKGTENGCKSPSEEIHLYQCR